ncbi:MAG: TonB-dependent receptor [Ginsengibacter sp.]
MIRMFKNGFVKGVMILILNGMALFALAGEDYNGRVRGSVSTNDGQPVAWVTVLVKNSGIATITDENGSFSLKNLKPGEYTLVVSYSGFQSAEKTVTVQDDGIAIAEFVIGKTAKTLQEIVLDGRKSMNKQPATIGKLPVSPMDLPQSFSLIDQSTLNNQQAQKLSDAIKNVNGVYLSATRAGTQETFFGRGYRLSGDNFFKNGTRINSAVFPEMSSLEKVEILKGGAAILYGEVAPGGIINMVTKKPKFDFGGEVSMRAGSYSLYKPSIDVYGPASKKLAVRVNGSFEDAGSFRDEVHSQKLYINPSALYKVSDKTELLFQADFLEHNFTPDFGLGSLNNTQISDLPRSTFQGVSWQYNKIKQSTVSMILNHKFNNDWSLDATAAYQDFNRDYYSIERIQAKANGDWTRPLNKIQSEENALSGQVNLKGKIKTGGVRHTLLAGVDADRYLTTNYTFDNPKTYDVINILDHSKFTPRTDIPLANAITRASLPVNRVGVYIQDLISISNKIKVLAGVRWSGNISENSTTTYLTKDSSSVAAGNTQFAFSPRFGIVYKAFANTAFFTSYSNSFSPNTRGTDVFGNPLDASIIDQYELGMKNDLLNGVLSINLTAYRIINNNLAQTAQFEKDGVTQNSNPNFKELVGQTTSDGFELDITGRPLKGLDLIAGYSYNNMRYTKTPDTKGSYVEGERLVGTPAHTANGSLFYSFSNKLKGLKLGASVFYTGDRNAGWNNTIEQAQNYSRLIPVKGFTTMDISAGYSFKKISILAKVSNITNTYNYYVHENYSINPIPPTQVIGTISYKF